MGALKEIFQTNRETWRESVGEKEMFSRSWKRTEMLCTHGGRSGRSQQPVAVSEAEQKRYIRRWVWEVSESERERERRATERDSCV